MLFYVKTDAFSHKVLDLTLRLQVVINNPHRAEDVCCTQLVLEIPPINEVPGFYRESICKVRRKYSTLPQTKITLTCHLAHVDLEKLWGLIYSLFYELSHHSYLQVRMVSG